MTRDDEPPPVSLDDVAFQPLRNERTHAAGLRRGLQETGCSRYVRGRQILNLRVRWRADDVSFSTCAMSLTVLMFPHQAERRDLHAGAHADKLNSKMAPWSPWFRKLSWLRTSLATVRRRSAGRVEAEI